MEFDLEYPLTDAGDLLYDTVPSLFVAESDHMPSESYLRSLKAADFDFSVRIELVSSILQCSSKLDPFLSYLAVNYLDRFLSVQGMPEPKPWILKLLAVSCVSLAAKMKETQSSLAHFQGVGGFIFDSQTIERMEVVILGALKWRMRSITPFCFLPFFISFFKLEDPPLRQALKTRASELIFKSQNEIKLLDFKPSAIAVAALLSASNELLPLQFPCFEKAVFSCSYVDKEYVMGCYNAMQDVETEGHESVLDAVSSSNTAVSVLDHHFSSSTESENTSSTITTLWLERDMKRRKITTTGYCKNETALHMQC